MKLLAYILKGITWIDEETSEPWEKILSIDTDKWAESDLGGNPAFITIDPSADIPENYADISSICKWGALGPQVFSDMQFTKTRNEIKELLEAMDPSSLTDDEKSCVENYQLDYYFKIYGYIISRYDDVKFNEAPYNIDYDIIGLHKKKHYNKGELYKIEYFGHYDFPSNTYSDLVLEENFTYYRINEMVYMSTNDISWYTNTDIVGATKQLTKYYTQEQSFALGESRRRNCITNLKINAVGLIMMTEQIGQIQAEEIGWLFLDEFNNEISIFIEGFAQPLKNAVLNTQNHTWLDNLVPNAGGLTVRQYLYDGINIDYTVNNTYV